MLTNIIVLLQKRAYDAMQSAFSQEELSSDLLIPEIAPISNAQFGHYQCNNPLKLAKALKTSPRLVAEKIVAGFNQDGIENIEIAGPGFINITLSAEFLSSQVTEMVRSSRLGIALPEHQERVIVEFSSPNVAKELHVGHLRSTIIGDCLARVFEFLGHDVLRLNHIGDWGTQFGMLITYMQDTAPDVLEGKVQADLPMLMQWYRASKKRFDDEVEFKKRAQLQVVALQGGDSASLRAWKMICEISRRSYQEIYDLLDVKLTERGESFYNPYLQDVITDLTKKGLIEISDGAKCIFLEGFETREGTPLPMIVQKSDGGYNYDTTDLAALRHRVDVEKADRIIVVTDAGQILHFQMLVLAAKKAGYLDPEKIIFNHVPFGVVLGPDGKKFKTRSGETEKLIDLLLEAVTQAKKIMKERLPELSDEEIDTLARILGIDAVKYADLSCNRLKDYFFSYERMLRFEGNTAAFLLYAYVRVQGIKRKVGKEISLRQEIVLKHPTEIALALHLRQFGEALAHVERELLPNRLCDYLYELAEKFHAFFRDCRVEGVPEEQSRLLLCELTARVLSQGLHLLGLKTLDRM
ncbi:MAG: arginine--tRNA ligase [Chlamydiota bacterium]